MNTGTNADGDRTLLGSRFRGPPRPTTPRYLKFCPIACIPAKTSPAKLGKVSHLNLFIDQITAASAFTYLELPGRKQASSFLKHRATHSHPVENGERLGVEAAGALGSASAAEGSFWGRVGALLSLTAAAGSCMIPEINLSLRHAPLPLTPYPLFPHFPPCLSVRRPGKSPRPRPSR